jgi:hypothetical protein
LSPSSVFYQALLQNLRKKQKLTTATSEDDLGSDAMAATTPSTPKTPATAVSTPLSAAATGNTPLSASAAARSTFFFGPDFNPEVGGSDRTLAKSEKFVYSEIFSHNFVLSKSITCGAQNQYV